MQFKPKIKRVLLAFFTITLLFVGVWIYSGIRLGIWSYSEYERYFWLAETMPITREFWPGKIKAGDDVEPLISKWQPHVVDRYGSWVEMRWYPGGRPTNYISFIGISVLAKDGVLVRAGSFSDDLLCARTFFNTLTVQAEVEQRAAFKDHVSNLPVRDKSKASPPEP